MASRRSSNARSCSNRSPVTEAADWSRNSAASGSSSIPDSSSSGALISFMIASAHSEVDLNSTRLEAKTHQSVDDLPEDFAKYRSLQFLMRGSPALTMNSTPAASKAFLMA